MSSLLCPSSIAKPGAALFGVQTAAGQIEYLDQPIVVDQTFVDKARQGRAPEERFRFASNCAKSGCGHWDSGQSGCSLVGKVVDAMNRKAAETLGACAIRTNCRWYHQEGALACTSCDEVVRNGRIQAMTA